MRNSNKPTFFLSIIPIVVLLVTLGGIIIFANAEVAQRYSYLILLGAAGVSLLLSKIFAPRPKIQLINGIRKSASQILPAIPILVFIAIVSATWMLSGVVPTLIAYGIDIINPTFFLMIACAVCAAISVLSGSSWTTIATIGVAFQGIGQVMGYSDGWIAGAIISGAYFGDKVSPLSDTTVLASSACKVDLFTHIKYLMLTSMPAMVLALLVYGIVGALYNPTSATQTSEILPALQSSFNITPWTLVIPVVTGILIVLRVKTLLTLAVSSVLGFVGIFVFQPQVIESLGYDMSFTDVFVMGGDVLFTETAVSTGNVLLDSLVSTRGVEGMLPTIFLVLSAIVFGGILVGTGMLETITKAFTDRLRTLRRTVGATVGCGLFLNGCTGDQYLSIILGANLFGKLYAKNGLEPRLLSRTLEDSVSVTSVLIPWNSCGITQASVLGVATLTYLPYCIFNIASPLLSLFMAWTGWKIKRRRDI